MKFPLPSGRIVNIIEAHFKRTHRGYLVGGPTVSGNRDTIQRDMALAAERYPGYHIVRYSPANLDTHLLPGDCWTLELLSSGVEGTGHIWSAMVVVWYTDYDDARPFLDQVREGLRNLQWDRFAKGWEP